METTLRRKDSRVIIASFLATAESTQITTVRNIFTRKALSSFLLRLNSFTSKILPLLVERTVFLRILQWIATSSTTRGASADAIQTGCEVLLPFFQFFSSSSVVIDGEIPFIVAYAMFHFPYLILVTKVQSVALTLAPS